MITIMMAALMIIIATASVHVQMHAFKLGPLPGLASLQHRKTWSKEHICLVPVTLLIMKPDTAHQLESKLERMIH
jgi:hypothetical protein